MYCICLLYVSIGRFPYKCNAHFEHIFRKIKINEHRWWFQFFQLSAIKQLQRRWAQQDDTIQEATGKAQANTNLICIHVCFMY